MKPCIDSSQSNSCWLFSVNNSGRTCIGDAALCTYTCGARALSGCHLGAIPTHTPRTQWGKSEWPSTVQFGGTVQGCPREGGPLSRIEQGLNERSLQICPFLAKSTHESTP
ncbi:hypothetical protein CEXT_297351 [Caerostris extrusa]|uniref:Uncharacterized protein n=1 Tax=Caerostris extrusa TaxID=172846 RepID=A0AAV4MFS0_CAEEX|nr:hypothetical protein CEXT_297351 [Caerostris extrusa]